MRVSKRKSPPSGGLFLSLEQRSALGRIRRRSSRVGRGSRVSRGSRISRRRRVSRRSRISGLLRGLARRATDRERGNGEAGNDDLLHGCTSVPSVTAGYGSDGREGVPRADSGRTEGRKSRLISSNPLGQPTDPVDDGFLSARGRTPKPPSGFPDLAGAWWLFASGREKAGPRWPASSQNTPGAI